MLAAPAGTPVMSAAEPETQVDGCDSREKNDADSAAELAQRGLAERSVKRKGAGEACRDQRGAEDVDGHDRDADQFGNADQYQGDRSLLQEIGVGADCWATSATPPSPVLTPFLTRATITLAVSIAAISPGRPAYNGVAQDGMTGMTDLHSIGLWAAGIMLAASS